MAKDRMTTETWTCDRCGYNAQALATPASSPDEIPDGFSRNGSVVFSYDWVHYYKGVIQQDRPYYRDAQREQVSLLLCDTCVQDTIRFLKATDKIVQEKAEANTFGVVAK